MKRYTENGSRCDYIKVGKNAGNVKTSYVVKNMRMLKIYGKIGVVVKTFFYPFIIVRL